MRSANARSGRRARSAHNPTALPRCESAWWQSAEAAALASEECPESVPAIRYSRDECCAGRGGACGCQRCRRSQASQHAQR